MFDSLRRAIAFLTPLPTGSSAAPTPKSRAWFGLVGAGIGGLLGLLWWGSAKAFPIALAAALVVVGDLAITGMLHVDGLVDSADGLLPHLDRTTRLAVMRDPTTGAFGVAVAGGALLLRFAALADIRPAALLLIGLWMASRSTMSIITVLVPYARSSDGGLASTLLSNASAKTVPGQSSSPNRWHALLPGFAGLALSAGCMVAWHPVAGSISLAAGLGAALGVVWLAWHRIGGFTGDVLGASGIVLETIGLVVASAKW